MDDLTTALKASIKYGLLPKSLYRYRNIDVNLKSLIKTNTMWFSKPTEFNDPFDCKKNLDEVYTKDIIINYANKQSNSIETGRMFYEHVLKQRENLIRVTDGAVEKQIINSFICCFSEVPDNLLLWSHYANGHKGVCLKFNLEQDLEFFTFPVKVNYSKTYHKKNFLSDPEGTIQSILTTKSEDWKYEKEIRVIKQKSETNQFEFNKNALTEIIFGVNSNEKHISELISLVKESGYNKVKFTKMTMSKVEFSVYPKPIKY